MNLSFKAKISLDVGKQSTIKGDYEKPLTVSTGAFSDTKHYSGLSTAYLYSILVYGTGDGRIPRRDTLSQLKTQVEDQKEHLMQLYKDNIDSGLNVAGHAIGTYINNRHIAVIYNFMSPGNAPSTIKKKGFDNPFIDKGELISQIFYSINGEGRFK